jgi:hypothetical protein
MTIEQQHLKAMRKYLGCITVMLFLALFPFGLVIALLVWGGAIAGIAAQ